jgi:DNA-directed RNA polymerase subunit RPC12/RpoP
MAKKSLGYVELEWHCPNCSTRNPGTKKTCLSCGMPQPEDVKFQQAANKQLIKDEEQLEKASQGADIHCYYCGSRNAVNATSCSQCGADLSEGSQERNRPGHRGLRR